MVASARFLGCALLLSGSALVYACSDDPVGPVSPADAGTDTGPRPPADDGAVLPPLVSDDGGGLPFDPGVNVSNGDVLINEISGGDEWVELVNAGAAARDLGGYRLADRDKTTGAPKLQEALVFPAGTSLGAGAYAMVRGGGVGDAGKPCPGPDAGDAGAPALCFNAEFGIGNKDGETIFLLAPDGTVVGKVVYPSKGSSGSRSYSRIPSGVATAGFEGAAETPGAPNVR